MKPKYVYWQEDDMWLGYLEEYPDYWTQGKSEAELRENLLDIYAELDAEYEANREVVRGQFRRWKTDLNVKLGFPAFVLALTCFGLGEWSGIAAAASLVVAIYLWHEYDSFPATITELRILAKDDRSSKAAVRAIGAEYKLKKYEQEVKDLTFSGSLIEYFVFWVGYLLLAGIAFASYASFLYSSL